MNSQSDTYQVVVMAIISFMTGVYAIWTGILTISKGNIKIPGLYNLGIFISKKIRGETQTAKVEKDLNDPKTAMKYVIFWLLIGLAFLAGSFVLLFVQ